MRCGGDSDGFGGNLGHGSVFTRRAAAAPVAFAATTFTTGFTTALTTAFTTAFTTPARARRGAGALGPGALGGVACPFQRAFGHGAARNRHFHQIFDGIDVFVIRGDRDGIGLAQTPGAAGAADAVDVIFGMRGHIEVEDMADGGNIQPARGHVRGHQQMHRTVAKAVKRAGAHRLIKIAVDGGRVKAVCFQGLGHHIHIHLAVAEDDRVGAACTFGPDDGAQNRALFGKAAVFAGGLKLDQLLLDRGRGGGLARDLDLDRAGQEGVGDPLDLGGHGGGIKEGLAGEGGEGEDAFDVGDEAHVKHAVGLVHHHDLHAGQQQFAALVVIKQAAGGGDQHINAAIYQLVLFTKRHAADQQGLGQLGIFGIGFKVFRHLRRQFAGGGQHQRTRHPGLGAALTQQGDHRQHEACGLAGAGLRYAQHVAALQRVRDGLCLNGGGGFVAGFRHGFEHTGIECEV